MFLKKNIKIKGSSVLKKIINFSFFLIFALNSNISYGSGNAAQNVPFGPSELKMWGSWIPYFDNNSIGNLEFLIFLKKYFPDDVVYTLNLTDLKNDVLIHKLLAFFNLYCKYIKKENAASEVFSMKEAKVGINAVGDKAVSNVLCDIKNFDFFQSMITVQNAAVSSYFPDAAVSNNNLLVEVAEGAGSISGAELSNLFKKNDVAFKKYIAYFNSLDQGELQNCFEVLKNDENFKKLHEKLVNTQKFNSKECEEVRKMATEYLVKSIKNANDMKHKTPSFMYFLYEKFILDYRLGWYFRWGALGAGAYLVYRIAKKYLNKMVKSQPAEIDSLLS